LSWELALQIVQTVAILVGVVFGVIQLREISKQREMQAGLELLKLLQAPELASTIMVISDLPDGLDEAGLRECLGDQFGSVHTMLAMFESFGPLVARGHVPMPMYAEFYRGPTLISWRKLRRYVEDQRRTGWASLYEWVQWLAERLEEQAAVATDIPAYRRYRTWKRSADYERLCERFPAA
jgi:hypothetical protein